MPLNLAGAREALHNRRIKKRRPKIPTKPVIEITYCTRCKWLLRAGWMAEELLSTFESELGGVTLIPDETGGVFEITLGDHTLWSRAEEGGFPDIAELKRRVRDHVAPDRDMGHLDRGRDAN